MIITETSFSNPTLSNQALFLFQNLRSLFSETSFSDGYLNFLRQVADVTPFVNFSCLNEITCDSRNYYERSHYRPNIGLLMLRILLDEDFEERESLASSQFGVLVTRDNIDSVIDSLQAQFKSM